MIKQEAWIHEAIENVLLISMRHSNSDVYIPTDEKKNRIQMSKPQATLEKMNSSDVNTHALNISVRY